MKWLMTLAVLATVLLVAGTAAAGSTAKDPRVPALQKKVTALGTQIGILLQQVQHDELVLACGFAQQDAYNILNLNLWATLLGVPAYNGPGPNDGGACAKLGLPAPSSRSLASRSPLGAIAGLLGTQLRLTHVR
jgi:hypothetical protein